MVQRRDVIAGMAAAPLVAWGLAPALAQPDVALEGDVILSDAGDITIHPVDHASLVIGFNGEAIYVDPVGGAALYEGLPQPTAILITHGHGDHFDIPTLEAIAGTAPILASQEVYDQLPEALKANASAIANGDDTSLNGLVINAVPAYNVTQDRLQYHPKGVGNGYVLNLGEKLVYVAGDTEPTDEMLALRDIDIAFLPMNLPYTMTPDQAAEAINIFKPKIVYPYHYGDSDLSVLEERIGANSELRLRNWYAHAEG